MGGVHRSQLMSVPEVYCSLAASAVGFMPPGQKYSNNVYNTKEKKCSEHATHAHTHMDKTNKDIQNHWQLIIPTSMPEKAFTILVNST